MPESQSEKANNLNEINDLQVVTIYGQMTIFGQAIIMPNFSAHKSFIFNVLRVWHLNCSPSKSNAKAASRLE